MTTPAPETLEREKDKFFVTDAELYRRLGVPYSIGKPAVEQLEARAGFPRKERLWGNRRCWPAVVAWFVKSYRINPQDETPLNIVRGSFGRGGRP